MAEPYRYTPIDSKGAQIRLFEVNFDITQALGYGSTAPITGSLKEYYLSISTLSRTQRFIKVVRLPSFAALSYVWGDPVRSHQVIIDGKALGITENLYYALRDLQTIGVGKFYTWIDAICINQDDLTERSEQILLMREIYSAAADVHIWLGKSNADGIKCMNFIANLTGGLGNISPPLAAIDQRSNERFMTVVLKPTAAIVKAGCGFGQAMIQITDIIEPAARDDKARMVMSSDTSLSLHEEMIQEIATWRPSARRLRKVQKEDFVEIARLIDKMLIDECPWFSRMWVVQELGASESPATMYGGGVEVWENFLKAIYYLHYTCNIEIRNIRKLTGLEKIRLGWKKRYRQPLQDLIRECRYRQATDPRDKIYALFGLMGDQQIGTLLQPDYTKSVGEVYARTATHFIIQHQSLDPICGWQVRGRQELPSWVPDYNLDQDLAPFSLVPQDRRESIFAASGYDHRSKHSLELSSILDWETLRVSGIVIDTAATISYANVEEEFFGAYAQRWCSTMIAADSHLPELSDEVAAHVETITSVISRFSDNRYSRRPSKIPSMNSAENLTPKDGVVEQTPPRHREPTTLPTDSHKAYIFDAYIQSMFGGRGTLGDRQSTESLMHSLLAQDLAASSGGVESPEDRSLRKALDAGTKGRSLVVTSKGYVGTVLPQAQPGDLVCVLYGCSVPVVLRKRLDDEAYTFFGECYLHGFMDAEAIAKQIKNELEEQEFILR